MVGAEERQVSDPVRNPVAVGGEARIVAVVGDALLEPSEGRNDVHAATVALGAEDDAGAIGREAGLDVIRVVVSERDRSSAASNLLNPDIKVSAARAIGRVAQEPAVRGQSRLRGESGI